MLMVTKLHADATLPTVAHPGEDLGYDIYALNDATLLPGVVTVIGTGLSMHFESFDATGTPSATKYGLIIKDRSSMALRGITTSAGVLDYGYTDEVKVLLTLSPGWDHEAKILAGHKIAQVVPVSVMTLAPVFEINTLRTSTLRGLGGFGSSGI